MDTGWSRVPSAEICIDHRQRRHARLVEAEAKRHFVRFVQHVGVKLERLCKLPAVGSVVIVPAFVHVFPWRDVLTAEGGEKGGHKKTRSRRVGLICYTCPVE